LVTRIVVQLSRKKLSGLTQFQQLGAFRWGDAGDTGESVESVAVDEFAVAGFSRKRG
jgi:hypothetical protein